MDDLKPYIVFAETVAAGSMSAAARRLRMTPSAVSQIIRALERRTGVALFIRSTRKLTLTEAGERCYPHCLKLIEAGRAANASLEQARDAPAGELRIAAPVGFGAHIAPALAPVLAEWPQLRLRLMVDDDLIDLIDARIDIALRVGPLADSAWIGRKLGELTGILCASPAYLQRRGTPRALADLERHDWLALTRDTTEAPLGERFPEVVLELQNDAGDEAALTLQVRTVTTNQIALQQMCEQGMGIARLFYADVRPALERGTLTHILPNFSTVRRPITLLTSRGGADSAKVRVTIEALRRYFATLSHGPVADLAEVPGRPPFP